jgi:DNA-binding XRE family transcriptional regulator
MEDGGCKMPLLPLLFFAAGIGAAAALLEDREDLKRKSINRIAKNLAVLRKVADLSQQELAEKIDVSRQTIVNLENSKIGLSFSMAVTLAAIFDELSKENVLLRSLCNELGISLVEIKNMSRIIKL